MFNSPIVMRDEDHTASPEKAKILIHHEIPW
jgi:hypothetical protein